MSTSFVDLLQDHVWYEADITRRTEAMIRSQFSADEEAIISRKLLGISLNAYTPTSEELEDIARYDYVAKEAQLAGAASRADMELLSKVFIVEDAARRLSKMSLTQAWTRLQEPEVIPAVDDITGEVLNSAEIEKDRQEREEAESVVVPNLIEMEVGLTVVDPDKVAVDELERAAAQSTIDQADLAVLELFELRKTRYK